MNKSLEQKVELKLNEYEIEFNNPLKLEYYLIESSSDNISRVSDKKAYGIEVVKWDNEKKSESELIKNFSCCKENTRNVLKLLASNSVTPTGLYDVINDVVGVI